MYNDLFTVFGLTVHGYGLMIGLGVLAALWMGCARAKARGLCDDTATTLVLLAVIIGFVGAKIFFVLTHFTDFLRDPWGSLGSEGFVVYGGIIFGAMACYVWLRRRKQSFLLWADILMPGVALAQGLGRVGWRARAVPDPLQHRALPDRVPAQRRARLGGRSLRVAVYRPVRSVRGCRVRSDPARKGR